jgi:hypothetical protein
MNTSFSQIQSHNTSFSQIQSHNLIEPESRLKMRIENIPPNVTILVSKSMFSLYNKKFNTQSKPTESDELNQFKSFTSILSEYYFDDLFDKLTLPRPYCSRHELKLFHHDIMLFILV